MIIVITLSLTTNNEDKVGNTYYTILSVLITCGTRAATITYPPVGLTEKEYSRDVYQPLDLSSVLRTLDLTLENAV